MFSQNLARVTMLTVLLKEAIVFYTNMIFEMFLCCCFRVSREIFYEIDSNSKYVCYIFSSFMQNLLWYNCKLISNDKNNYFIFYAALSPTSKIHGVLVSHFLGR